MKIKGTDFVKKTLDRLLSDSAQNLSEAVEKAGRLTSERADALCNDENIKKSISVHKNDKYSLKVDTYGDSAVRTEFGSEQNPPSPFIVPALMQSTEETQKYIEEIFKK